MALSGQTFDGVTVSLKIRVKYLVLYHIYLLQWYEFYTYFSYIEACPLRVMQPLASAVCHVSTKSQSFLQHNFRQTCPLQNICPSLWNTNTLVSVVIFLIQYCWYSITLPCCHIGIKFLSNVQWCIYVMNYVSVKSRSSPEQANIPFSFPLIHAGTLCGLCM